MAVSAEPAPLARRYQLSAALKQARKDSGLTREETTSSLGWSLSKLNRIESGYSGIAVTDLNALLRVLGIEDDDTAEDLRNAARDSRVQSWWYQYRDLVPEQFARYLGYESTALSARAFHPYLVPELLRTRHYAETLLGGREDPVSVRRLGELHALRQEQALSRPGAARDFILGEEALHRPVGGPRGMREQVRFLLDAGELSGARVRIVPFSAGAHPGLAGAFVLLRPEGADKETLIRESGSGGYLISDDSGVTEAYNGRFADLESAALPEDEGRELLRDQIKQLEQE